MSESEILLNKKTTSVSESDVSTFAKDIISLLSTHDIFENATIESTSPFVINTTDQFVTFYRNNKYTLESIMDLFISYDTIQGLIDSSEIVNIYTYRINRPRLTDTLLHKIEINDFRPFEFLINSN